MKAFQILMVAFHYSEITNLRFWRSNIAARRPTVASGLSPITI